MIPRFDFWRVVTHKGVPLPRIVHHLSHCAVGLPVNLVIGGLWLARGWFPHGDRLVSVFPWLTLVLGTFCAIWDKRLDIQWTEWRSTWIFGPPHWNDRDWWDFWSDYGLTLLGAFLWYYLVHPVSWLTAVLALLLLGIVNGV